MIKPVLATIPLLLVGFSRLCAQHPPVTAARLSQPIVVDGRIDDAAWSSVAPLDVKYEVDPRENAPAAQRTTVKFAYTDDMLYAAFECFDSSMTNLRAQLSERDRMFNDDLAILIVDPYGDNQRAYEFFVNPYNVQGDALRAGENEDPSYELVWYSGAALGRDSWTVEMGIPFKSIRIPDREEQVWTVLAGRKLPRETNATLSATTYDRNNPCLICQGFPLIGIRGLKSGLSTEILPYVLGSQQGSLRDADDPTTPYEQGKVKGRAGVGVKVSPTPDIVVEATVNPDFSQIESDAAQISVNTTFALFFQEKRPFFLEGSDLFRSSLQGFDGPALTVFYTRTVNDPLVAAKVSGKAGALSFGVLSASDRNTALFIPGEERSDLAGTGMKSLANVGRIRYDLGGQSYIGGVVSHRALTSDAHNIVGGIDWNYRFLENHAFRGVLYYSDTRELNDTSVFQDSRTFGPTKYTAGYDGESYGGLAARLDLSRSGRNSNWGITMEDLSPTFQAQNGFITRTNRRNWSVNYGLTFYPDESNFVTQWGFGGFTGMQFNYGGHRKERFVVLNGFANMKGQMGFNVNALLLNQERFRGLYFPRIPRTSLNFYANPSPFLSYDLYLEIGNFIYRRPTPPELGYGHNAGGGFTVRFTERARLSLSYNRSRLSSDATRTLYFDGNIFRATGIYQFSAESFLRLITQYDSFDKALNIYPLFSYRLNPFTVFYAGATRDYTDFGGATRFQTTSTQYFLKLQYLIQS
ncbi:MAG: hypothetical protein A3H45_12175 [Ignavibacteria bacterium RIFCSPLOWO2_02_FULL_55_14]|nr:MAG: hypothetical protein A3H45_12175 [Ignavibacteria bacterium RIFCSPLOWO2_02_FULL_55_14]OGU74941.1 MAG: hypothetical protein A3G43_14455 [Ignavibacteria bacterium RIFCSPLOWO2_12_FULL_56_21]